MDEAKYDILLNDIADYSPVNSMISLDCSGTSTMPGMALEVGWTPGGMDHSNTKFIGLLEGSLTFALSSIQVFSAGAGIRIEQPFGPKFYGFGGGSLNFFMADGKVGEVGEREGDYYLDAPDGERYYTGSPVEVDEDCLVPVSMEE